MPGAVPSPPHCSLFLFLPLSYSLPYLDRSPFDEHSHETQISSCFSTIQRNLFTYLFPNFLCDQLSNHAFFNSCPPSVSDHFSFQVFLPQPGAWPQVLPTGRISLHHCPSEMSQRGAEGSSYPLLGSACILCRTICKLGLPESPSVN